jgi:hypothetical protein
MPKPLSPRALRLIKAGEILFGERYQSALARALGLSQTYVSLLATGDRSVTDANRKEAEAHAAGQRKRLRGLSAELAEIIKRIIGEQNNV